jgi:alkylated DNA repair dioxygenase AlkB
VNQLDFSEQPEEVLPHDGSAVLHRRFLGPTQATSVLAALTTEVEWEQHSLTLFGKSVLEPRLSAWVADSGVSYAYSGKKREPLDWTPTLSTVRDMVSIATGQNYNSVLANLYRDGSDSMGWHADDEPELGRAPVIASISLGAERRFDFRHNVTGETRHVLLPHGSLLVMSGDSQACWKHRLTRSAKVRGPRINLTYRLVVS